MSGFYSASQFDHAFKPTKLRNWEYGTNPFPGKLASCPPSRIGSTGFIAKNNGHLCPCSCRNPATSPWGDYALHIWEQPPPCGCLDKHRHPEHYRPPADIYITKVPPKSKKKDAEQFVDEDPNRFAEGKPPSIKPIPLTEIIPKKKPSIEDFSCDPIPDPVIFGQEKRRSSTRNRVKTREEFSENTQILLEQRDAKRKEGAGGKKMGGTTGDRGGRRRKGKRGESGQEPITLRFSCDDETLNNKPKRKPKWRNN